MLSIGGVISFEESIFEFLSSGLDVSLGNYMGDDENHNFATNLELTFTSTL
jgi:hypothetical protein